jgi:D-serine dehydratase
MPTDDLPTPEGATMNDQTTQAQRPLSALPFADWMKGMPSSIEYSTAQQIADLGLSLLSAAIPLPCAVLKESALRRNETWMLEFARRTRVKLCPHGKTTMSPELFARQLSGGALGHHGRDFSSAQSDEGLRPYSAFCTPIN